MANHFQFSTRTIERDLSALQQAGVPIYATPGRRGGYALDLQHTLPPLNLSAAGVAAVASAVAVGTSTPFTHAGRAALQKIQAVLREVDAESTRELAARVRLFDSAQAANRSLSTIERAIVERRVVEIDYVDKIDELTSRTVEPIAVLGLQPHWYLWAYRRLRQAPRVFRFDRIRSALLLDEPVRDRRLDPADIELGELINRGILGDLNNEAR